MDNLFKVDVKKMCKEHNKKTKNGIVSTYIFNEGDVKSYTFENDVITGITMKRKYGNRLRKIEKLTLKKDKRANQ